MTTIKKISKLGKIGGLGRQSPIRAVRIDAPMTGGGVRQLDLVPEQLREVQRRIGNERARRVWRLKEQGVVGTLPELCAYDWLERRNLLFEFQSSQMGGRMIQGGAVVDFMISGLSSNGLYIWRVQGEYWHTQPDAERKDDVQKARLMRLRPGGVPVAVVVDLWEDDIYDRFPEVFVRAEFGEGLRG